MYSLCAALFEGGRWSSILRWTPQEWAALLYQSLGVYGIAKFTQQIIIRHLGAQLPSGVHTYMHLIGLVTCKYDELFLLISKF